LTVSGVTANNKNYDGNTTVTLNTGSASLVGVIGSDAVTLVTSGAVGTFASKDAASGITVTTSGFTLGGANAGNYTLIQPVTIATILPLGMAIGIEGVTAANKVYDGTTTAVLNTTNARMVGVIAPDIVTLSTVNATGNFSDKNVGVDKSVVTSGFSISGVNAGNYTLMQPSLKANITSKNLTVSGITANNKTYDGTTTATLNTASGTLNGVLGTDAVSLVSSGASGAFVDKNAGQNKNVTPSGLSINGTDAINYTLAQPVLTGNILPRSLTIKAKDGSKCSGTTYNFSGNSFTADGLTNNDTVFSVTLSSTGVFQNANAGTYDIIAGNANGTTLTNYTITYIKGVLTVNPIANQPADFLISTSVVCLGTTGVAYTVPKDSLVTYTWNYTGTGVTINGKTNAVSLDFSQNASSGVLSVIATTSCGNSPPRKIDITVNTLNTKPVVTFTDNTLNSNIGTGIQWYRNMTPIQGATSQNYTPVENGKYFIVCKNNCISDTSNYVDVLISNTEQYMNNSTLQIFPNPAKEYFMLRSTAPMTGSIKLSIFSSDCILVRNYEINNKSFSKECQIDIRQLKPGLYFIRIDSAQKTTTKKLIIL